MDPIWRRAPTTLVRHYPAYGLALLLGAAALTIAALSGPTLVDAAEIAMLRGQVDAVPDAAPASERGAVRAALLDASRRSEDLVATLMAALPGARITTIRRPILYLDTARQPRPVLRSARSREETTAVLFDATDAVRSLVAAPGSPDPRRACEEGVACVWVPDTVARRLDLAVGDRVVAALEFPDGTAPAAPAVAVTGVYATDPGTGAPQDPTGLWDRIAGDLPAWPQFVRPATPQVPLLVCDPQTFRRLASAEGERPLVTWDAVPEADPVRIADAAAVSDGAVAIELEANDRDSGLARSLFRDSRSLTIVSGLPEMVQAAREGRAAVIGGISAVRVVAIGFAWLVVVLATVGLVRRRAVERQALADAGRSGVELTGVLLLEAALPLAVGTAVGLAGCVPTAELLVGAEGRGARGSDLAIVVGVMVATVAGVSAVDHTARARRAAGRRTLRLPWRTVILTVAAVVVVAAYVDDGPGLDVTSSVLPLAVVGAAAIILAAAATASLRRLPLPRSVLPRLVLARLARDATSAGAFLVAAVTFGTLSTGLFFADSVDSAVSDKVAVVAGAETTAEVATAGLLPRLDLDAPQTPVWRVVTRLDGGSSQPVMVIDPHTFRAVALRSDQLAGHELAALEAPTSTDGVPVLLAGSEAAWQVGQRHRLVTDDWEVTARAVGRVEAFPGMGDEDAVVVASSDALFPRLGRDTPTRLPPTAQDPDGVFTTELWAAAPGDTVAAAAASADVFLEQLSTAAEVRATPALQARDWVTDYLRLSTVLVMALGLVVLSGLHRQDADRRRVEARTLADLGHPAGLVGRAAALQLALVALAGAVVGTAASYAATRALAGRLDPLPDLAPRLAVSGLGRAGAVAAALLAVALLLTLAASRRGRSVNEMLREV
jgi:hypothetical protein